MPVWGVADSIVFQAGLTGQVTLTTGELVLTQDVTIDGDNTGDNKANITISGNNANRIFAIIGKGTDADLLSLTLTNGKAVGAGGAIYTASGTTLDILDTTVRDSTSSYSGGGIWSDGP